MFMYAFLISLFQQSVIFDTMITNYYIVHSTIILFSLNIYIWKFWNISYMIYLQCVNYDGPQIAKIYTYIHNPHTNIYIYIYIYTYIYIIKMIYIEIDRQNFLAWVRFIWNWGLIQNLRLNNPSSIQTFQKRMSLDFYDSYINHDTIYWCN